MRRRPPVIYWCRSCGHSASEHQAHGCKRTGCACQRTEAETRQPVAMP